MEKGGTSWNENGTAQHKRNIANCQIENASEDWFTRAMQMQTQTQMEMQASRHV